jgi:uncharacterized damage-inducible protein DinB
MKEILKQLAAYHVWANQRIFQVILALPEEKQLAEVPSSFNSLYKTILHCWDAESIWWQRIKLQERIIRPSESFRGSMTELADGLLQQSRQWEIWISNASELSLEHVCQYQSTKRELFKQPVYQIILHVFNHGTFHRGQLVNMLRQLGLDKLPATDLSLFSVSRKSIS